MNLAPTKSISIVVNCSDEAKASVLTLNAAAIRRMTRADEITAGVASAKPGYSASSVVNGQEVFVPLKGLIDLNVERNRLEKELARLQVQLARVQSKLSNETFVSKAPAEVLQ